MCGELIERLKRHEEEDTWYSGGYRRFAPINPDGPEAAKELERLSALWVQEIRENERLRAFASDVQWEVIMDALDKWIKHGGSDLVALGIIGQGLLILDDLRRAAKA